MHVRGKIIAAIEHLLELLAGGGWLAPGLFFMELDEVPRASCRRGRGKAICMQESYLKGCTGRLKPVQSEVCVPCLKNEGRSTSQFI